MESFECVVGLDAVACGEFAEAGGGVGFVGGESAMEIGGGDEGVVRADGHDEVHGFSREVWNRRGAENAESGRFRKMLLCVLCASAVQVVI